MTVEPRAPGAQPDPSNTVLRPDEVHPSFGLLDALIVCAENLKLLVLGPSIAALIALSVSSYLPRSYTSMTYLGPFDQVGAKTAEALMRTPIVLDSVLQKHPVPGNDQTERRGLLNRAFRWELARGADRRAKSLYTLEVTDASPERAKSISGDLVSAWLEAAKPQPEARERLASLLERSESHVKSLTKLIDSLEKEKPTLALASPLASLLAARETSRKTIDDLKMTLAGTSGDLIVAPPSPPSMHTWPTRRNLVGISVLGTLGALLLVLLLRYAIRLASAKSESAPKIARLKAALWSKR